MDSVGGGENCHLPLTKPVAVNTGPTVQLVIHSGVNDSIDDGDDVANCVIPIGRISIRTVIILSAECCHFCHVHDWHRRPQQQPHISDSRHTNSNEVHPTLGTHGV